MKIAILAAVRPTDIWNIPIAYGNEFKRRGFDVRYYNTLNLTPPPGITQLQNEAWTENGVQQLLQDNYLKLFQPDIVFHLDFGLFRSQMLTKENFKKSKWIYEAGDDPQCFRYNFDKVKYGRYDLVLSPDIRAVNEYNNKGYRAVWCPHFADHSLLPINEPPLYDVVTSRHYSEDFYVKIKNALGNKFIARDEFLEGANHLTHLMKGKIVLQNSKYKEITRRIFEGMLCNRMVLTDRVHVDAQIDYIFKENRDIIYFDDFDDCIDKIRYYTQNDDKREEIAKNGFNQVIKNHTVAKRVEKLLEII